jgi:hypothetical protein
MAAVVWVVVSDLFRFGVADAMGVSIQSRFKLDATILCPESADWIVAWWLMLSVPPEDLNPSFRGTRPLSTHRWSPTRLSAEESQWR